MDLSQIGQQFGLSDEQTQAALESLAPVVAAGMRRSASSPQGLQDLMRQIVTGGHQDSLDRPEHVDHAFARPRGNAVLEQVFGNKDVSRGVAQQLSASTGIGAAILRKLLPIVASIVMGQIAKRMGAGPSAGSGGGFGDILKDILGGGRGGGGFGLPGGSGGGGDIPNLPQSDLGRGGRQINIPDTQYEQAPQADADAAPAPRRTGNPLEDMLNDILTQNGGKGGVVVKQIPPDQMGEILRDIFGGQFPGGSGGQQMPAPQGTGVERGRRTIEDMTGGGTRSGNAADDLLNSVERSIRGG
jgi:hypothetical protein